MAIISTNGISGISSFTSNGTSITLFSSTGQSANISASNITASDITASSYIFSTQGFTFQLKDSILTPTNKARYVFSYTGANQSFTVPTGVNWIFVKLWGAGGGAGRQGGWNYGADGGGGGHTRGLIPVTPGQTIFVAVGRGGTTSNGTTQSYGGGGTNQSNSDITYGGHGGGYCGVFVSTVSQVNALAVAGGGGAGGSSRAWFGNIGGAGGGLVGQRGSSPFDGKFSAGGNPGTQTAGGSGGVFGGSNGGAAGSALQGGAGGINSYGGGGGGGYWGGGGGGYSEQNTMGGGGGGSGYVIPTSLLSGTYAGQYRIPSHSWDPDLLTTTTDIELPGYGGQNTQNNVATASQSGGHAYAVIYY